MIDLRDIHYTLDLASLSAFFSALASYILMALTSFAYKPACSLLKCWNEYAMVQEHYMHMHVIKCALFF